MDTVLRSMAAVAASLAFAGCLNSFSSPMGQPSGGGGSGAASGGGGGQTPSGDSGGSSGPDGGVSDPQDAVVDPLAALKTGRDQWTALCARGNGDAVSRAFCAGSAPPTIGRLADLQALVGIAFQPGNTANGQNGNPAFVLTGHSTSLVTRFTSAINPRAIIMTPPNSDGRVNTPNPLASFVAMGFVRGEQFVELVSNDPAKSDLTFFLFRFTQACNTTAAGCSPGDLLTPAVEQGFTGWTLYQDVDVQNTVFDCLQCHQRGGASTKKILRMQELQRPWGHWMTNRETTNGQALLADYTAAHGSAETYAGIPGAALPNSNPEQLEGLVENQGFQQQPNEFDSNAILDKGDTAAWQTLYDAGRMATAIPAPFHENRVADPAKLTQMTNAYAAVRAGTMPAVMLPDIRDVFAEATLPDLGFRPAPSLVQAKDGKGILVQMCQQCHNPALDQTLSRAKFDVTKLATMERAEKDKAILRLTLPKEAARRMPPTRFRELSPEEIQLVTDELRK